MIVPVYSTTKTCKVCKITKDVSEFRMKRPHLESIGRYYAECLSCESEKRKTDEKKALHRARCKKYDQTPKGKEARRRACYKYRRTKSFKLATEKYRSNNPEKRKAQIILTNALSAGKIIRPDICSVCHSSCKPEAHHFDYQKPLDVIWTCKRCHAHYHWSKG